MTYNEIQFLLLGLTGGIFVCWLYLKYKMRDMPSFEELLSEQGKITEKMMELLEEQREGLDIRMKKLIEELDSLLSKSLEDPKDILH